MSSDLTLHQRRRAPQAEELAGIPWLSHLSAAERERIHLERMKTLEEIDRKRMETEAKIAAMNRQSEETVKAERSKKRKVKIRRTKEGYEVEEDGAHRGNYEVER